jgi:hypothetical protein
MLYRGSGVAWRIHLGAVDSRVLSFIPSGKPLEISISQLLANSAELLVGIKVRLVLMALALGGLG